MTLKPENIIFVNKELDTTILSTVFKRAWFWIPLMMVFFISLGFIYLRYTKPVYESSMVIQVTAEDQGADVLDLKNVNTKASISREIELLRSEFIFEKALRSLDLNISHYAEGEFLVEKRYHQSNFNVTAYDLKDSSLCHRRIFVSPVGENVSVSYSLHGKTFKYNVSPGERLKTDHFDVVFKVNNWDAFLKDAEKNKLYFEFNDIQTLASRLVGNLVVTPLDVEARTIQIVYKSNNAHLSRDIVSAVAQAFFNFDERLKKKSADNILQFINVQLDSLTRELKSSKDSIMMFQRKESLPDPDNYGASLSQRLEKLQQELITLNEESRTLDELEYKIKNNPNRLEVYKMIPDILGYSFESSLYNQVKELHALLERKEDLMYDLTAENQTIKTIESRVEGSIQNINRTLDFLKNRADEKLKFIKSNIKELELEYFNLPEKKMELTRLRNLQELNEKYYTLFTEKQVQYSISNAGYTSQSKVLKRATASSTPVSPKKTLIYGATGFFGFLIGFGILFFKYVSFNELNQVQDLERILPSRVGILGGIPLVKKKMTYSELVVADAPKSMIAESLRTVRTNLSFIQKDARVIAISSSISGEGKTFVALNLAGVIAMSGKKTVLIDLDLRKPKIHLGLGVDNEKGMSNLLVEQFGIEDCIKKSALDKLDFITAGPVPPNPSELLLKDTFINLIEKLKEKYDNIIIDNPPIGLVSDGMNILAMADIPIYVFKANYSKRHFISRVEEISEIKEITNLNVILNGVKRTAGNYGYGYGYGGYYEDEKPKRKWWHKKR